MAKCLLTKVSRLRGACCDGNYVGNEELSMVLHMWKFHVSVFEVICESVSMEMPCILVV